MCAPTDQYASDFIYAYTLDANQLNDVEKSLKQSRFAQELNEALLDENQPATVEELNARVAPFEKMIPTLLQRLASNSESVSVIGRAIVDLDANIAKSETVLATLDHPNLPKLSKELKAAARKLSDSAIVYMVRKGDQYTDFQSDAGVFTAILDQIKAAMKEAKAKRKQKNAIKYVGRDFDVIKQAMAQINGTFETVKSSMIEFKALAFSMRDFNLKQLQLQKIPSLKSLVTPIRRQIRRCICRLF